MDAELTKVPAPKPAKPPREHRWMKRRADPGGQGQVDHTDGSS